MCELPSNHHSAHSHGHAMPLSLKRKRENFTNPRKPKAIANSGSYQKILKSKDLPCLVLVRGPGHLFNPECRWYNQAGSSPKPPGSHSWSPVSGLLQELKGWSRLRGDVERSGLDSASVIGFLFFNHPPASTEESLMFLDGGCVPGDLLGETGTSGCRPSGEG